MLFISVNRLFTGFMAAVNLYLDFYKGVLLRRILRSYTNIELSHASHRYRELSHHFNDSLFNAFNVPASGTYSFRYGIRPNGPLPFWRVWEYELIDRSIDVRERSVYHVSFTVNVCKYIIY